MLVRGRLAGSSGSHREMWQNCGETREDTLRALVARTAQRTAGDGVASLLTGNIVSTLGNIGKYACVL